MKDSLDLWWTDLVREVGAVHTYRSQTHFTWVQFRMLLPEEIPEPYSIGCTYDTVVVNPQMYIPWLQSQLIDHGVQFVRKQVNSLEELKPFVGSDGVLVNASALGKWDGLATLGCRQPCHLGSKSIIGIEDTKLFPIRGQTILIQSSDVQGSVYVKDGVFFALDRV